MPDRTGQQLGNYILKSLLGQGGFADVYLGEHIYLKRLVAVKVLQMRMSQMELQEFVQEAQMIAALEHTHIVRVHDFGVAADTSFLVMDYAPQGSLRHKHPKGATLSPATIVPYVKQIAAALQYAHDQKLIHRDIKPENMLLGKHNDILVSDFGLAVVARSTRSWEAQKIAGTAPYMSPEHFKGKAVPTSDQYSLAVTVYEWLTGSLPFDEGDFMQLGYRHSHEPVPPLHEKNPTITVPPPLEQVIMKGLAKEPGQRFERIEAFANALEQALRPQEPIIVKPRTPPKPAIVSPPTGTTLVIYREHTNVVNAVDWSPDGIHIASSSSDGTVQVWDMVQQREILQYTGHSDWIRALSWSPNGRYIVSGGGYAARKTGKSDFTLHIWDTTIGKCILTYKGHSRDVYAIRWSPDGKYIASGDNDNVVQVWEATTGRRIYTYTKHTNYVYVLAWSLDSYRLASGSLDSTVQVWNALTGSNVLSYRAHGNVVAAIAWSPDGRQIASGSWDKTVQVWQVM